ncbi:hypothetical protein Droror1_Dr00024723 [Drosera rotundifolia]
MEEENGGSFQVDLMVGSLDRELLCTSFTSNFSGFASWFLQAYDYMSIPVALWHSLFHLMPRLHLGMDPIFKNCDLQSPGHALSFIAAEHRHVGSNNFNLLSSRSHTIFTLMIESGAQGDDYDGVIFSQLNLIDLAGSESSKTETTGLRRKEGSYINKSLLTLGTVIGKLSEGKASHVPYRDSKLTRLLQSSLSGRGHVSLICTVTPASSSTEETHSTLKFASRAKRVEIYASRNKIIDEKSLIKKYQREISNLKQELDQLKKGMLVSVSHEEILTLKQKLEEDQVKMQSRLEEEEEAKAGLMSRIQRLPKLIFVSTKNGILGYLGDAPAHQRWHSASEDDKSDVFRDVSLLAESDSTIVDSNQAGEIISTAKFQTGKLTTSDEMDLLMEQVKMLAGDIALSTSTLKRLVEQSVNDPEAAKTQNLECEIQDKKRQKRVLEQRITHNGEASVANTSVVDMQQIRAADNRILQEQLQNKCVENRELQERIQSLEQQLSDKISSQNFSQARKQREAALEAALAEKEYAEKEYKREAKEFKKREASLENDLANLWVLVAKLKKEGEGIPNLKGDQRSNGIDNAYEHKRNDVDVKDVFKEIELVENIKPSLDPPREEPLVARLTVSF